MDEVSQHEGAILMPHKVDISIFDIGGTKANYPGLGRWLKHIGATEAGFEVPNSTSVNDAELLISMAAKRCYMSFVPGLNPNVERVRTDYVAFLDNILSSGHGSVLEHVDYLYAIEGVSRVFTGEMNRHRAGWAIAEGSMRFIRFEDIPFWMPNSFLVAEGDSSDLEGRKYASQRIMMRAFQQAEDNYAELGRIWNMDEGHRNFAYKKRVTSAMRRVIPMGVATGGVWKGNIRALRHVIALRTDEAAEEEIFHVFGLIGADIIAKEPKLFQDFQRTEAGSWITTHHKV